VVKNYGDHHGITRSDKLLARYKDEQRAMKWYKGDWFIVTITGLSLAFTAIGLVAIIVYLP